MGDFSRAFLISAQFLCGFRAAFAPTVLIRARTRQTHSNFVCKVASNGLSYLTLDQAEF